MRHDLDLNGSDYLSHPIVIDEGGTPELAAMGNRMPSYRALQWADVQAIADAEGVSLEYAPDCAQLHYRATARVSAG